MKSLICMLCLVPAFWSAPASALTVKFESEGPMLAGDRLGKLVNPLLAGEVSKIADVELGGTKRLHVRLRSKYFADDQSFIYLVEMELQQRVIEAEVNRVWWPSLEKWVLWGSVPSEAELRRNITDLVNNKVNAWKGQ